jgi:hypothetical protein
MSRCTCACEVRDGVLVDVCAMHAEYGRTMAREAVQRNELVGSKAPSHTLGRARVNVHERIHECEKVVNDLDMLWQELHFVYRPISSEELINMLMGMELLYKLRFARLKDEFDGFVREVNA